MYGRVVSRGGGASVGYSLCEVGFKSGRMIVQGDMGERFRRRNFHGGVVVWVGEVFCGLGGKRR